jgi:antitoxin YefM
MNAVNYSELRRNPKSYMDRVYEERERLIVTRENNENVVVMSVDRYNSLVETSSRHGGERPAPARVAARRARRANQERELADE